MKIVVLGRTLNESANIERFCRSYGWADEILLADGGSSDNTIELAKKFKNVQVKYFNQQKFVAKPGEYFSSTFMNPESTHVNFLLDWSSSRGADWLLCDDIDCVPNKLLQEHAREIFEKCPYSELKAYRLYTWMNTHYFPDFNNVGQLRWAWKPSRVEMRCNEADPVNIDWGYREHDGSIAGLAMPYVLIHYGWPTEEVVKQKMERYEKWGRKQNHPLQYMGRLEPLPDWAVS